MSIEQLQTAIESLPTEDYARLRQWFHDQDWEKWDRQIEADSRSGKLNFLLAEARHEKPTGG